MAGRIFFYALLGAGIVFIYVKYLERTSIFFPAKIIESTPKAAGLNFTDVYISTSDKLKLNGWFIPYPWANKTVLFLHGNAGNISSRLEKMVLMRKFKVNIFILDYRGYGNSQGNPKEEGVYLDAEAAYDYLVNERKVNPRDIILYGESLGGAVAIDLAAKRKVGGMILEGTFSSGRDIGQKIYPYLPKFILPDVFNSLAKIKAIAAPKLFIHSRDDEVVPYELGKKLFDFSPPPKKFITLTGSHNDLCFDADSGCIKAMLSFIAELKEN